MTTKPLSEQAQLVLDTLKSGRSLTNMVALTALGVGSLTSRIAELRKAGLPTDKDIASIPCKDLKDKRYIKYVLVDKEPA